MNDLPPKSPNWGTLGEEPGISKPPASGGWGYKEAARYPVEALRYE